MLLPETGFTRRKTNGISRQHESPEGTCRLLTDLNMWVPEDYLPPPFSVAAITDLLTSIGLPKPLHIHAFKSMAAYHSVYMISLPPDIHILGQGDHLEAQTVELVLRVSGHHFPSIKTINEAAVISWVKAHTSIPVPDVVRMSDSHENILKHEYVLQRRLPGTPLNEAFLLVTPEQMDGIISQVIDLLVTLHATPWQHIGGLKFADDNSIVPGPMLEEIAWQVPEIQKHWGSSQTFESLNILGPYPDYVSYISAHVERHIHAITHHSSLTWMRGLIPRLHRFIMAIRRDQVELNNVQLRLSHNDIHFSNIMIDPLTAKITGILDWEFAQVVPYTRWDPMTHFLANQGIQDADERDRSQVRLCQRFEELCTKKGVEYLLHDAKYTSTKQESMQLAANLLRFIVKGCPEIENPETMKDSRAQLERHIEVCIAQS